MYMAWKKGEKKDLRIRQRQGERAGSLSSPINIRCYHTFNILFRVSTKFLQLLKDLWPGFIFIFDLYPLIASYPPSKAPRRWWAPASGPLHLLLLLLRASFLSDRFSDAHLTPCPSFSLYPPILTFFFILVSYRFTLSVCCQFLPPEVLEDMNFLL